MRIISFDVGMKNLAYCLFVIPDSLGEMLGKGTSATAATAADIIHHIKIERWDVIDLRYDPGLASTEVVNTPLPKQFCMNDQKLAKWMMPAATATATPTPTPTVSLYCAKCAEKSKYKIPCREILQYKSKPELIMKKKLDELIDIKANLSKSSAAAAAASSAASAVIDTAAKNIKCRKADLIQEIKSTLSREYLEPYNESKYTKYIQGTDTSETPVADKPKKPNYVYAHDLDLITYGRNLMKHLDAILYPVASASSASNVIDMMIVENQISTLASRMKTLQGMITQYFIMKQVPQIEFISASCKLKLFTDSQMSYDDEMNIDASTYADRKKSGIVVCRSLGEISRKHQSDFAKWMACFENHKKKDDLADCFLQGLWRVHLLCAV
jgi:hypothetical protein